MGQYPDMTLLASEDAGWLQQPAEAKMDSLLQRFPDKRSWRWELLKIYDEFQDVEPIGRRFGGIPGAISIHFLSSWFYSLLHPVKFPEYAPDYD